MTTRRALTLIELLVVIGIIGVLMGLMMPAIQSSRENTRRVHCGQNLHQLGLALANHENARGRYPTGTVLNTSDGSRSGLVQLLQFLDRADLRNKPGSFVPEFHCPSDRDRTLKQGLGPTNYVLCTGSGIDGGTLQKTDGIFYASSSTNSSEVRDGASNTIAISESTLGEDAFRDGNSRFSSVSVGLNYKVSTESVLTDAICDACQVYNNTAENGNNPRGYSWSLGDYRTSLYNHRYAPNTTSFDCLTASSGWRAARSLHRDGVNVIFADGHLEFISNAINLETWRAMSTRDSGDLLEHREF